MPKFESMTDREILIDLYRHRAIAQAAAEELMRRANEEPTPILAPLGLNA